MHAATKLDDIGFSTPLRNETSWWGGLLLGLLLRCANKNKDQIVDVGLGGASDE